MLNTRKALKHWNGSGYLHSPPAPTPAIPRATINIQNIPVGDVPLAAADNTMPITRRVVVALQHPESAIKGPGE